MADDRHDDDLADLVLRAQTGDRDAFSMAYERLYPRVWGFVSRRRRRREDVEDLVSLTFHRFLARIGSYEPRRGTVRAFVLSIAHHALIDEARARRPHVSLDEAGPLGTETTMADLLRDDELRVLRSAIARLKPDEQEVLVLRYGDGLQCNEIGVVLGLKEDAVKKRLSRLLHRLRMMIDEAIAVEAIAVKGVP
jgi:RNA polymerase sigma-70 factor (ECF subfamily)